MRKRLIPAFCILLILCGAALIPAGKTAFFPAVSPALQQSVVIVDAGHGESGNTINKF